MWPRTDVFRAIVTALALFAAPLAAVAQGALAVGIPHEGVEEGFAFGFIVAADSREAARAEALQECRRAASESGIAPKFCRVINTFRRACVAVAMDTDQNGTGAGWSVAATVEGAREEALRRCRAIGGARAEFCVLQGSDCDDR